MQKNIKIIPSLCVAPARERGLKYYKFKEARKACGVAPARERGLKFDDRLRGKLDNPCRSREGAWIEMTSTSNGWKAM